MKARLALLNLSLDATAVRSLADSRQDGTHGFNEMDAHLRWSELECSLYDIVAIGVAHKLLKLLRVHKLFNHHGLGGVVSAAHALLNHIRAELLLGKLSNLASEAVAERIGEAWVVEIENVLDDIIAKRILHEMKAVCRDASNKLDLLEARSMINAALEDAAAMTVSPNNNAVLSDSIKDELSILSLEVVKALLDHMITVEVLDEIDDLIAKSIHNHLNLVLVSGEYKNTAGQV